MTTIDAEHAADLYELFDDHGVIDTDPPLDEDHTAHGWTLLGSTSSRTSRWHERYWMVIRDSNGDDWGIEYGVGLTENQEDDLPWERGRDQIPLVRLYPHKVVRVEYRRQPAEVAP